jgi:hypothetical protein
MRLVREGDAPGAPALVLPGRGYDADQPVLRVVREELLTAGYRVLSLFWDGPAPAPEQTPDLVRALVHDLRPGFVVAKSLTTLGLPVVADCGLAGIWLTPLLDHPEVGLAAARSNPRTLLVGGTADPTWNRTLAHESDREVLEVLGADHSLEFPGDPAATAAALEQLRAGVRAFLA